ALLPQRHVVDDQRAVHRLQHVHQRQRRSAHARERLHLHARAPGRAHAALDVDRRRPLRQAKAHVHRLHAQRVGERDPLVGALRGHHRRQVRGREQVPLRRVARAHESQRGRRHAHTAAGHGVARGLGLGAHVHHADPAAHVEMGEWAHRGSSMGRTRDSVNRASPTRIAYARAMGTRTQRAAEREAAPRGAPAGQRGRGRWLRPLALAAALACAVIAVHWPALGAQGLALDDDAFVVRNPLVQRPGWESTRPLFVEVTHPSTVSAYSLPLSMTSLMVDWAAGGRPGNLAVFHVTSLLLHVAATLLVFLVLRSLFGSDVPAALAALLYGVHPLMVEPIASAGERKPVLATALALASLHAHLRWATGGLRRWWLASIAWFLLALLAKPSVVTLPLAMLVLDVWPLRRGWRTAALEKWPHVLLAAVAA